jgi:hypothetical protein
MELLLLGGTRLFQAGKSWSAQHRSCCNGESCCSSGGTQQFFSPEAVYIVGVTLEVDAIAQTKQIHRRACVEHLYRAEHGSCTSPRGSYAQQPLQKQPAVISQAGADKLTTRRVLEVCTRGEPEYGVRNLTLCTDGCLQSQPSHWLSRPHIHSDNRPGLQCDSMQLCSVKCRMYLATCASLHLTILYACSTHAD